MVLDLYVHFFNSSSDLIHSVKLEKAKSVTFEELQKEILSLDDAQIGSFKIQSFHFRQRSAAFKSTARLSTFLSSGADLFCKVEVTVKAVKTTITTDEVLKYKTVAKYSFWEDSNWFVKLRIELTDIQNLDKSNIECDFENRSLDLKIKNLNSSNYRFAIKKLEHSIDPSGCKFILGKNRITLKLKKEKETDTWNDIAYVKPIGES